MSLRTAKRPRIPRPRKQAVQRTVEQSFGYLELVQSVNELKALKTKFETEHKSALDSAEKKLADYVKNTRKGDRGSQGPRGLKGESVIGPRGPRGEKGNKGDRGRDGKELNEKAVVRKVSRNLAKEVKNQIPSVKSIVKKVVKLIEANLNKKLTALETQIRQVASKATLGGTGGGMGNFTTFSLDGDGSTTEFTLPATPTQEGLAVLAYYQGQWLQPGVHYSVSGTTITLTFTMDNNTKLEGLLIT